jgi:transmembrane sensor
MNRRDRYTKIEDFLSDDSFRRWVKNNDDFEFWEDWALETPERAFLVKEARLFVMATIVKETPLSKLEINQAFQKTWSKIQQSRHIENQNQLPWSFWLKTAATLFLVGFIGLGIYFIQSQRVDYEVSYKELIDQESDGLIEQINNSARPLLITLSDGSSVLLQAKSKLSYPKIFTGKDRKVFLSGEAFFEISKDPQKPFFVYANEVVTQVYGTSFRVIAYANQPKVEVLVKTGQVRVRTNREVNENTQDEIILLPNQAARYSRKQFVFEKITNITADKPLTESLETIEKFSFEFRDTPVIQILSTIEQAYSITIEYPEARLQDCYLTTSLTDVPLAEKFKIICESLGNNTSYEMNGNNIKINSNGCN